MKKKAAAKDLRKGDVFSMEFAAEVLSVKFIEGRTPRYEPSIPDEVQVRVRLHFLTKVGDFQYDPNPPQDIEFNIHAENIVNIEDLQDEVTGLRVDAS